MRPTIATVLPHDAVIQLLKASTIDAPRLAPGESLERTRELDAVVITIKSKYPQFFKETHHG